MELSPTLVFLLTDSSSTLTNKQIMVSTNIFLYDSSSSSNMQRSEIWIKQENFLFSIASRKRRKEYCFSSYLFKMQSSHRKVRQSIEQERVLWESLNLNSQQINFYILTSYYLFGLSISQVWKMWWSFLRCSTDRWADLFFTSINLFRKVSRDYSYF